MGTRGVIQLTGENASFLYRLQLNGLKFEAVATVFHRMDGLILIHASECRSFADWLQRNDICIVD